MSAELSNCSACNAIVARRLFRFCAAQAYIAIAVTQSFVAHAITSTYGPALDDDHIGCSSMLTLTIHTLTSPPLTRIGFPLPYIHNPYQYSRLSYLSYLPF